MQKIYPKEKKSVNNESVRGPKRGTVEFLMQFARMYVPQNNSSVATSSYAVN